MNLSDVPKGWKVYVLTWTWLGIAAGLASGAPLQDAFIIWAVGASAGWLLASTVRHKGWTVAVGYFAAAVISIVVALICAGQLIQSLQPSKQVRKSGIRFNLPPADAFSKQPNRIGRALDKLLDAPRAPNSEEQRKEQQDNDTRFRSCLQGVNEQFPPNLRAGANVNVEKQKAVDECYKRHLLDFR